MDLEIQNQYNGVWGGCIWGVTVGRISLPGPLQSCLTLLAAGFSSFQVLHPPGLTLGQ